MSTNKGNKGLTKNALGRNWMVIVYPESAPPNWRDILNEEHTPWIESPLHDKDMNEDGELKKAHYHVMIMYPGQKSFKQMTELLAPLNTPMPKVVANVNGQARYFAHMDDKDKYQYSPDDIIGHAGADVMALINTVSKSERYELMREIMAFVNDNHIVEIKDLLDYAMEERFSDWFPILVDGSGYIIDSYIRSNRYHFEKEASSNGNIN